MSGREQILAAVRRSLHRGPLEGERRANLEAHIDQHARGPQPERSQGSRRELVDRFVAMAEEVSSTVARLPDWESVPEALASYLQDHNLPARLRIAPDPKLRNLDWAGRAPMIEVSEGLGEGSTMVGLVQGFAGVAETGTLMIPSGSANPTSLNFLPDSHVVVLPASAVVGGYEGAWDRLRDCQKGAGADKLPRTVNLITGPSRTGDIEQILQLGAHGPRRLHILLVEDDPAARGDQGTDRKAQDGQEA